MIPPLRMCSVSSLSLPQQFFSDFYNRVKSDVYGSCFGDDTQMIDLACRSGQLENIKRPFRSFFQISTLTAVSFPLVSSASFPSADPSDPKQQFDGFLSAYHQCLLHFTLVPLSYLSSQITHSLSAASGNSLSYFRHLVPLTGALPEFVPLKFSFSPFQNPLLSRWNSKNSKFL